VLPSFSRAGSDATGSEGAAGGGEVAPTAGAGSSSAACGVTGIAKIWLRSGIVDALCWAPAVAGPAPARASEQMAPAIAGREMREGDTGSS
jgi:hypothetical protein